MSAKSALGIRPLHSARLPLTQATNEYLASRRLELAAASVSIPLVFASDMLDGMIARRRNEITFIGRYLDSTSDYLMIIAVSIVLTIWLFMQDTRKSAAMIMITTSRVLIALT